MSFLFPHFSILFSIFVLFNLRKAVKYGVLNEFSNSIKNICRTGFLAYEHRYMHAQAVICFYESMHRLNFVFY